jgi:hypothetical protein
MTNIQLWCKNGQHYYLRESQRGRQPFNCPEHSNPVGTKIEPTLSRPISETRLKKEYDTADKIISNKEVPDKLVEDLTDCKLVAIDGDHSNLESSNYKIMRKIWCMGGGHHWEAEVKRGRPPLSCPEHRQSGKEIREQELAQEKQEMAQKTLKEALMRKSDRVRQAKATHDLDLKLLEEEGGVAKAHKRTFNQYLNSNNILLNEILSLRSTERKLDNLTS